jgi:hypothetical protein
MLGTIIYAVFYVVITLILIHIAYSLICLWNMRKYTKQGIKSVYVPLIGAFKFFHPQLKIPHEDPSEICTTFYQKHKGSPHGMIVTNGVNHIEPTIYLNCPKVINEFYIKEVDYYRRCEHHKTRVKGTFYLKGGEKGLAHKGVFANFFGYNVV